MTDGQSLTTDRHNYCVTADEYHRLGDECIQLRTWIVNLMGMLPLVVRDYETNLSYPAIRQYMAAMLRDEVSKAEQLLGWRINNVEAS